MTTGSTIGQRIKMLRIFQGMKQIHLATATDIAPNVISRTESDHIRNITAKSLVAYANALGCSVDFLLGRTSNYNDKIAENDPVLQEILSNYFRLSPSKKEELQRSLYRISSNGGS